MFPSMDYEVIECVLRSNNGAVDATIDQLLQMSIDGQGSDDSSDSDDSIPAEVSQQENLWPDQLKTAAPCKVFRRAFRELLSKNRMDKSLM